MSHRRIVSVVFLGALALAASREARAQSASDTQDVQADILGALQIAVSSTAPPGTLWDLDTTIAQPNLFSTQFGANPIQVTVTANQTYTMQIRSDGVVEGTKPATDANRMLEYTGAAYVPTASGGRILGAVLRYRWDGAGGVDVPTTTTSIAGTSGSAPTGAAGRVYNVDLEQTVDFNDVSLSGTGSTNYYYIQLVFTITAGSV